MVFKLESEPARRKEVEGCASKRKALAKTKKTNNHELCSSCN